MSEKNLPIKFFQKRQKDEQDTEGGGERKLPRWVNDADTLIEKAIYINGVLENISTSISQKIRANNYIPSVIKLKLNEDALAKTYRKEIANIFNIGEINIIGVEGEDEVLVKIDDLVDLRGIEKKITNAYDAFPSYTTKVGISAITNIEEFKPIVDVSFSNNSVLKVKLFNYGNSNLNDILISTFEKYCEEKKVKLNRSVYTEELRIYRIDNITEDIFGELKDFDGIQLLTEMPTYSIVLDELTETNNVSIKFPKPNTNYPIVGVLDTGIAQIPHLTPWLHNKSFSKYHSDDINETHGTFVSGIILYGDELENELYSGLDGCKLFDATVMPNMSKIKVYEDELVENIREAISKNDEIKIWNLSLGTNNEADFYEYSDFAKSLDEIQERYSVLICKSAGNCTNFRVNKPKSRISKSADTVRGLVVGSISKDKISTDLVDKNHPSPFSRIGPGPSHLIKPDVVHIGGNAGIDSYQNIIPNPVKSLSLNGDISKNIGTSFSTPRIAAIAAGINFMLNENFNPSLIKALIIHSAKYPKEMNMSLKEKLDNVGFGLPSNINDILFNQSNEITLILQDTLEKGNFIDILDFPFPQSMIDDDGFYYGEVTITLVTAPILESSQGAEYCQSNIDVLFGTYDEKVDRDTNKRTVKNPIGADGRQNLLSTSMYSKKAFKDTASPFATERMLISYGDKYQPIKKWSINFDDFTGGNREKYLRNPKNWYLKLEGLFRNFTETKCELERVTPSQEFCLIVTIKDTKKRGNIYNEVTKLLDNNSFIHSNVKINEEVVIRLNN
jgi:hypothetical protein